MGRPATPSAALELVASTGGDDLEVVQYDEFLESLVDLDPGHALAAVAFAVQQGRDPRSLTEDVVRYLRDCFLSLMAPELVALPDSRATVVAEQAGRLGAGKLVKAMERLGEILVEMRHSPDPRLLLEIALVQLTHQAASNDIGALMDRIERLEKALAEVGPGPSAPAATPVDPATGRVPLGARARRDATGPMARPALASVPDATGDASSPGGAVRDHQSIDVAPSATSSAPTAAAVSAPAAPHSRVTPASSAAPAAESGSGAEQAVARWSEIVPALKPLVRAIYSVPKLLGVRDGAVTLGAPNDAHRIKCEQHRPEVERVAAGIVGSPVRVVLVTDGSARHDDHDDHDDHHDPRDQRDQRDQRGPAGTGGVPSGDGSGGAGGGSGSGSSATSGAGSSASATVIALHPDGPPPADEDIDLNDLVDAPPESVVSPIDRLAQAFPGSELMDERD